MTIQSLREGLALMGVSLTCTENSFIFEMKGVSVSIDQSLSEQELEVVFFFLKLNILNWCKLTNEAINEEMHRKGGKSC